MYWRTVGIIVLVISHPIYYWKLLLTSKNPLTQRIAVSIDARSRKTLNLLPKQLVNLKQQN